MPKNLSLTRRRALKLGLGALGSMGLAMGTATCQALDDPKREERDFTAIGGVSLKQRAAAKGLIYGAAIQHNQLAADAFLAAHVANECGMLVPEWALKWSTPDKPLRPTPNSFDFTAADWIAKFAKTHDLLFRGHTLVWYQSLPPWFEETVNSQNAEQFLTKHIKTVVGRYAGQMHSWDVVNEAIETTDGRSDGLKRKPWLELLGPDYIEIAFRVAAEADPQAMLVYNDNGLEYDTREDEAKRTAVLKLLERLKNRGIPVHAFGMQSHLRGEETRFSAKKLQAFLHDIAGFGLKILITEMDVTDQKLPKDADVRDRMVAAAYEDYLSVALDQPAVIAVLTWGLSDRFTWLSSFAPREDGSPLRPLPLDAQLKRKLAWNAIARAFDKAPKR